MNYLSNWGNAEGLSLLRKSLKQVLIDRPKKLETFTIVIFGASGGLAKAKIFPTLWFLFKENLLSENSKFVGYSRTHITISQLRDSCQDWMQYSKDDKEKYDSFWNRCFVFSGGYDQRRDLEMLNQEISMLEDSKDFPKHVARNRIFYLALPPSALEQALTSIHSFCKSFTGWNRVVIEKPFGKDLESSNQLSNHVTSLFNEQQVYRIDHCLGKEMVQNLMTLRFGNLLFSPTWNRDNIASVLITFKETTGIKGDGKYFDQYGIIRDMMQSHLLQMLSLVAMEKPTSTKPDDIRNAKVTVLKSCSEVCMDDLVLGQYFGNQDSGQDDKSHLNYLSSPDVNPNSLTATFAAAVVNIKNERWDGVPFILRCGKALNEQKTEIRIQYKDLAGDIFGGSAARNELVLRVKPGEAVYVKMNTKTPGMSFDVEETELNLTYKSRYKNARLPESYERLILDVFLGSQMHFVRTDELFQSWRIFTPLLNELERSKVKPIPYRYGSRGPSEADQLMAKYDFKYTGKYQWKNNANV